MALCAVCAHMASRVMCEADTNHSGLITYSEFMRWPGKHAVLEWIDAYHERVLSVFGILMILERVEVGLIYGPKVPSPMMPHASHRSARVWGQSTSGGGRVCVWRPR